MANEKRMIELDELIDNIDWDNDIQKWTLRGDPEDISTVDAVEVVHGRWLDATHIDEDFGEVESYECSVCGKWDYYTPNYTPNCGAKMDGDGNG